MFQKQTSRFSGFTLIELLIVVAIIAILAAIAVPNFLEAQTRAKVSRVVADMRSIKTGLESYSVDYNRYPPNLLDAQNRTNVMNMSMGKMPFVPYTLTTPIAYMTTVPLDTFKPRVMIDHTHSFMYFNSTNTPDDSNRQLYRALVNGYMAAQADQVQTPAYSMTSTGPDLQMGTMAMEVAIDGDLPIYQIMTSGMMMMSSSVQQYDASNGTISQGDIVTFGP